MKFHLELNFLFYFEKLKKLDDNSLKKYCLNLESFLKHDVYYDIDDLDLLSELIVLKEVMQIDENIPINVLNYLKRLDFFQIHILLIEYY